MSVVIIGGNECLLIKFRNKIIDNECQLEYYSCI